METLFAFETWGIDGISALHEGERATAFIEQHYASGTYATLHEGGQEVRERYEQEIAYIYSPRD